MTKAPNFIALELPYNGVLMLPAAMAEAIVNNAIIVEKKYTDGVYTYNLHDRDQINLTIIPSDTVTAMQVAKRVTE